MVDLGRRLAQTVRCPAAKAQHMVGKSGTQPVFQSQFEQRTPAAQGLPKPRLCARMAHPPPTSGAADPSIVVFMPFYTADSTLPAYTTLLSFLPTVFRGIMLERHCRLVACMSFNFPQRREDLLLLVCLFRAKRMHARSRYKSALALEIASLRS